MTSLLTSETQPEPQSREVEAQCPEHGAYAAKVTEYVIFDQAKTVTSGCPACADERKAQAKRAAETQQAAERQRKLDWLLGNSGIPARFADRSFDIYRAEEQGQKIALAVCKGFAEKWPERLQKGASLVLTGGPGTGKTHLACAIANAVMQDHLATVAFGTVAAFLRHVKSTYAKDSQRSEQDAIDDLLEPDLLILDEVGVQVGSEHEKLLMFEVLNSRYQDLRPSILISNLDIAEMETFLGHRVMDRYRECGSVLGFDWQSHRGRS